MIVRLVGFMLVVKQFKRKEQEIIHLICHDIHGNLGTEQDPKEIDLDN